jgi:2-polyprenyl-3-methyl-5-hydroxy-6-metoxy-1,4-benzoquinol methylase
MQDGYYRNDRPEMVPFIPNSVKTTLEVGCGEGRFSALLRARLGCTVWGIELNAAAAEKAASVMDRTLVGDARVLIDSLPNRFFDCAIINDVLEHLDDPWSFLRRLKPKLTARGVVVASIPNVRHISNLKTLLLNRDWRYTESGILDRTHLRFFTRLSIRRLFEECGLAVETLKGINRRAGWKLRMLSWLTAGFLSDTEFLQFACVGSIADVPLDL